MPAHRPLLALLCAVPLAACAKPDGNSGSTGTAGAGGTGPMSIMKDPSTYPQNTAGAAFPYPQGHAFPNCTLATYNTDRGAAAYNAWKTAFVTANGAGATGNLRVQRPENSNDTVSEGIGYGMLIGVYMNDKPMFDSLWAYAKSHFDAKGLMTWNFSSSGTAIGSGSATDGDEDMAYALLMASKQWSGGTYMGDATTLIGNIMSHEVSGNVLEGGDGFNNANEIDPSYFAPSYYRAFAAATGNSAWMSVLDESYTILAAATGSYGLVPNWVSASGGGIAGPTTDGSGPNFGYDACRTPFRIALDYCENGEPRAKTYLDAIVGFYVSKAPTALNMLMDGYTPTGTNPSGTLGDYAAGMAFYGPAAVAAMEGGAEAAFVQMAYYGLVNQTTTNAMNVNGVFTYFHASWGVLSLLATSGNFWTFGS